MYIECKVGGGVSQTGLISTSIVELLKTEEAARYLRVSIDTLKNWRRRNTGPPYKRVGERLVVYRKVDLDAWLERPAA
jgi:excisionase family DNA binding protein